MDIIGLYMVIAYVYIYIYYFDFSYAYQVNAVNSMTSIAQNNNKYMLGINGKNYTYSISINHHQMVGLSFTCTYQYVYHIPIHDTRESFTILVMDCTNSQPKF